MRSACSSTALLLLTFPHTLFAARQRALINRASISPARSPAAAAPFVAPAYAPFATDPTGDRTEVVLSDSNGDGVDTVTPAEMASDSEYMDFLEKSNNNNNNEDQSSAAQRKASAQAAKKSESVTVTAAVPDRLKDVGVDYVSEAEYPFEPVSLAWDGGKAGSKLSSADLARLIGRPSSAVDELDDHKQFDPRGQYTAVFDAVRDAAASDGDGTKTAKKQAQVQVFAVQVDRTRTQYWVVSTTGGSGQDTRVVGLKADSVES